MNLDILFEDEAIIVAYKPAGIATQTKRLGQQDMESILRNYRARKGEDTYIGIIHRLDQPVEGVMVFAKTSKAAAELSKQVQTRTIGKNYYALTSAAIKAGEEDGGTQSSSEKETGTLEDYLIADKKRNESRIATEGERKNKSLGAKKAVLDYTQKAEMNGKILYDVRLHTGRHHQIRVQFASRGCALVGDSKYVAQYQNAQESKNRMLEKDFEGRQLGLCSYRIAFTHPISKKEMEFTVTPRQEVFLPFFS